VKEKPKPGDFVWWFTEDYDSDVAAILEDEIMYGFVEDKPTFNENEVTTYIIEFRHSHGLEWTNNFNHGNVKLFRLIDQRVREYMKKNGL
jgi:hypothetical protein